MAEEVYIGHLNRLAEKAWRIGHAHEHPEDIFGAFMFLIADDDNYQSLSEALDTLGDMMADKNAL